MSGKVIELTDLRGLSTDEVVIRQKQYGRNVLKRGPGRRFIHIIWDIVKEPMFVLLMIACSLYFMLGETGEGIMMLVAMSLVTTISLFQELRSNRAIEALKKLTEPRVIAIRNGKHLSIPAEELVPGDLVQLDEGTLIPADCIILQENDLSVNESIITGESAPVDKDETAGNNQLYHGTTINRGKCVAEVVATGDRTELGKLGKVVGSYHPPKTILQVQVNSFVRRLALFGLLGFFLIFLMNYLRHHDVAASLLFALTLAMSAVPEEIPVAFSSFMALGAYKMSKLGIVSRQPQIIENLGSVTVICLDKTGTITENKMQVKVVFDYHDNELIELGNDTVLKNGSVLRFAMLASESEPFDPMEVAILDAYHAYVPDKLSPMLTMVYEYPLQGHPPMMTHVYEYGNTRVVAAKGAMERIMEACLMDEPAKNTITEHARALATKGYRVIGVASAIYMDPVLPVSHNDFNWHFEGLLALYDPPKKNIKAVLKQFDDAGIEVKLLTGDYPETAINIAHQTGIPNHLRYAVGEEIIKMNPVELARFAKTISVYARMFPDAKLKVIEALKANGEIVAMTGDGVNDGPSLKSAHIGIAMGKKGTEIARQASDLVLTDDNLEGVVTAITEGRKIFMNLKKAVRYIVSIHIPIILIASVPVILGWAYPNIFTPIHVIFLELIMGPTCSIFFEREPAEDAAMLQKPRDSRQPLFTQSEISISVVQGVAIATAVLLLYNYYMTSGASIEYTRTMVFVTLVISNVFLTFANRSFSKTLYHTIRYKNSLAAVIPLVSALFLVTLLALPAARSLFQLTTITFSAFWLCFAVAFASVMWFEAFKWIVQRWR